MDSPSLARERAARASGITVFFACVIVLADVADMFLVQSGALPDAIVFGVVLGAFAWTVTKGWLPRPTVPLVATTTTFACLYIVSSILHGSGHGLRNAASMFTVLAVFLFFFANAAAVQRSRLYLWSLLTGLSLLPLIWLVPSGAGKNMINGTMCYYLVAAFLWMTKLKIKTSHVALLFLVVMIVSLWNDHRALAGAAPLLFLQYVILESGLPRSWLRPLMFISLFLVIAVVIALLVDPRMWGVALAFNAVVRNAGERSLMSGRQVLWPAIWGAIIRHPTFGLDPGATPSSVFNTTLSSHNLYLQVGLQMGIVGMVLVCLLFLCLWQMATPPRERGREAGSSIMIVVITMVAIHSLFEVFLTQNALAVGVPAWMVLGVGLGSLKEKGPGPAVALAKEMLAIPESP